MTDTTKLADLPAKWLATAEAARSAAVSASFTECADELEAALSQQPSAAGVPVAYLDLGSGGYMDVGTDLTDKQLALLPKGRHMLAIIGTYGVDGYVAAPDQRAAPAGQQGAGNDHIAILRELLANEFAEQDEGGPQFTTERAALNAAIRAIAARQPVGQEPVAWIEARDLERLAEDDPEDPHAFEHVSPGPGEWGGRVPLYTAPPAQVDLSDVRRELSDALDLLDNTTADADEDANRIGLAELAITRAIESIDQQASKGADRG